MKKRILTIALALTMIFETLMPLASFAKESIPYQKEQQGQQLNRVKLGTLGEKDYPKIDTKTILAINKQKRDELNGKPMESGVQTFAAPWFPNQREPGNDKKNKLYGKIHANFKLEGLNDNGTPKPFDWARVFGLDEEGNPRKATIVFEQIDYKTGRRTGITNTMQVDKTGTFTWSDDEGNPVELPLYNRDTFEPYNYEVYLVQEKSKHVQLLTTGTISTEGGTTFEKPDANGKIVAHVNLAIGLEQVASTKFVSEWNTDTEEADRPNVEFSFYTKKGSKDDAGIFELPKNNTDIEIIRTEDPDEVGIFTDELKNVPEVEIADPDPDDPNKYEKDTIDFDRGGIYEDDVIKYKGHYYKYNFKYDVINGGKLTMTEIVPTTFDPSGGVFDDFYIRKNKDKPYVIWVEYGGSILDKIPKNVKKDGKQFLGWSWRKNPNIPDPLMDFKKITRPLTYYPVLLKDVIEYNPNDPQGEASYDKFVRVHVDLTDKAKIETGDKKERHFKVDPTHRVILPVDAPTGKVDKDDKGRSFTWKFLYWKEVKGAEVTRKWQVDKTTPKIKDSFTEETWIEAVYEKDYTSNNEQVETFVTHESKDGINNFLPTFDDLKKQIKIKKGNDFVALENLTDPKEKVTVEYVKGKDASGTEYTDFNAEIYDKLQEKTNPLDNGVEAPTRIENIKAKLTYPDGEVKEVDIPIKVIKNIYEAKTETKRPVYVPKDYIKVTVDPTTKAEKPQKYFYYVNPDAKVVIPGEDPTGTGNNKFVKWTMKADSAMGDGAEYKLKDKPRTQFEKASTITAQYVSDVIPQDGPNKPDTVPSNFVEVKFVPTDKATDETKADKIYWVNPEKEVTIPVKDPVGKQYFTFKEWKLGSDATGAKYTPSIPNKFTEATTITATYTEAKDIIPYNPDEPITRPDGYVRVKFEADPGLKLTEQKAYYVKKNANITLKTIREDATKGYPNYEASTGYKFDKWDKDDTTTIEATDIVVTATPTILNDVVPKVKPQGGENDKPAGYITVTFKTTEKGGNVEKVVYINPNKAVALLDKAPEVNPITGYEFADWDRPIKEKIQYKDNDVINAKFNEIGNVVPGDKNKPAGYVKVIFDKGEHGELSGTTSYWVKPEVEVTVEAPSVKANTGYKFTNWDKKITLTANKTDTEIKITAGYEKLDDIIPSTDDNGHLNEKPKGYVTVTFVKGEHGSLEGKTVYYVNPELNPAKTLADITKPTVKAETGYKLKNWNFADTKEITSDIEVTAQYEQIPDIVPKTKVDGTENKKPDEYITVTFVKGEHGELEGNTIFYINPNKAVVLEDKAPKVKPDTGYSSAGWDISINKAIQYKDDDKITALYNELGDVIPQEKQDGSDIPDGYFTVTFVQGDHGTLSGKTVYYVKPNKTVTVPAPTVTPDVAYKFDKWDKDLTQKFAGDTKITAEYKEIGDVISGDQTKPNGYVTVKFEGINGILSGQTVYYVNPNKEVDLTNTANAITKNPNTGYTEKGGTWDKPLSAKFKENDVLKFTFKPLDDVIEVSQGKTKPNGYVTVAIVPTYCATDTSVKYYWVNPLKEVTIPATNPTAKDGYKFVGWDQDLKKKFTTDTFITAKYSILERPGSSNAGADYVFTKVGVQPRPEDYQNVIIPPRGKRISSVDIMQRPDVSRPGLTSASVKINYTDGSSEKITVKVYVEQDCNGGVYPYPNPYPNPNPYPYPDQNPSRPLSGGPMIMTEYKKREVLRREVRYMQGFEGKFRPTDSLTRAEAAQILANALKEDGYKYDPLYKLAYKDIQGKEWYAEAVRITSQADVFKGYDDGNFKPDKKITRAEWISTLRRFQYIDKAQGNSMKLRSGHWAIGEIEAAYKEGWLKIYQDGFVNFEYDKPITRQEVAAVSNRAFNRVLDKKFILDKKQYLINYSDVNPNMWSYEDILCASNTFLHKRQGNYLAYKSGPKTYSIDIRDAVVEQDLFQRISR